MVEGAFFTSPKVLSRKSVRKSEVLPVLVWPTTARESGVVMVVGWDGYGLWMCEYGAVCLQWQYVFQTALNFLYMGENSQKKRGIADLLFFSKILENR